MGYYHISLSKEASNLCNIILTWVKHKYRSLPIGLCNSPDTLQEKMNEMFHGIELIIAYIYDLLIITKGDCSNHLNKLELELKNIRANVLKFNI